MEILSCRTDEEVELLAPNFTATTSHFGRVGTVELGEGGEERRVTLGNRGEYVQKLRDWLLTGGWVREGRAQAVVTAQVGGWVDKRGTPTQHRWVGG